MQLMVALRTLTREPAWMQEPELLWERRWLDVEDERDRADTQRLAEQDRFRGGDNIEEDA